MQVYGSAGWAGSNSLMDNTYCLEVPLHLEPIRCAELILMAVLIEVREHLQHIVVSFSCSILMKSMGSLVS